MAIVLTNGKYYITYADTGATKKTPDINAAHQFASVYEALNGMRKAMGQKKSYYVYDTLTQRVIWKKMNEEEREEAKRNKIALLTAKRDKNGKLVRKTYSEDTRKLIYMNAQGRCTLCGKKILLEDMTIDHIKPLSMGGADSVENLACTCYLCNMLKGNALPDDFLERITDIFMYQTEKKCKSKVKWKIVHKMVNMMV